MEEVVKFFLEAGFCIIGAFLFFTLYRLLVSQDGQVFALVKLYLENLNGV